MQALSKDLHKDLIDINTRIQQASTQRCNMRQSSKCMEQREWQRDIERGCQRITSQPQQLNIKDSSQLPLDPPLLLMLQVKSWAIQVRSQLGHSKWVTMYQVITVLCPHHPC